MGANFPGQSVTSCGQPSQVASCGSHSAGMRKPRACSVLTDGGVFIGRKNLTQRSQRAQRAHRKQKRKKQRKGRKNDQLRRVSSLFAGSHSTTRISSLPFEASATTCPKGSATKELPQNSKPASPFSGLPSNPTRLTTAA